MKTCAAVLPALLLLAACANDTMPQGPVDVEGPGYRGVILARNAWPSYASGMQGSWTPTLEDVRRAEAALPAAARKHAPDLTVPLERYYRQYVGVVEEGRRLLFVNLIHERSFEPNPYEDDDERFDLRTELYVVDDGGDWYVEAFYDPETDTFTGLYVHGEA